MPRILLRPLSAGGARALRLASILIGPAVLTAVAGHELLYNAAPMRDWLLVLLLIWALVLRQRMPLLVFAFCFALVLVLLALDIESLGSFALLLAIYSVAAHRDVRYALAAAAVLELGVFLVSDRFAPSGSVDDAVVFLSGLTAGALFLGTTFRAQRRYLASVEDRASRYEREQAQATELAASEERARIAREMHDIVAHGLAVVITLAEGAAAATPVEAASARQAMQQVAVTGRQSLAEMRTLLNVLRTDEHAAREPQPDLASLESLFAEVMGTGLRVQFRRSGDFDELDATVQTTIYRVVQESLTNVLKHAPRARIVDVAIDYASARAEFSIYNDGGPPHGSAERPPGSGNGITGMRERVRLFGGELEARSVEDGWLVRGLVRQD